MVRKCWFTLAINSSVLQGIQDTSSELGSADKGMHREPINRCDTLSEPKLGSRLGTLFKAHSFHVLAIYTLRTSPLKPTCVTISQVLALVHVLSYWDSRVRSISKRGIRTLAPVAHVSIARAVVVHWWLWLWASIWLLAAA